jgi:hypothetical protein
MFVLGKRGAASSMCKTIAASTSSFASRCFWPLHATTADKPGSGTVFDAGAGGYSVISKHDLRRVAENRHAKSCSGWGSPEFFLEKCRARKAAARPRSRIVIAAAAASATHPVPTISGRRTVCSPITTGHTPMRVEDPTV